MQNSLFLGAFSMIKYDYRLSYGYLSTKSFTNVKQPAAFKTLLSRFWEFEDDKRFNNIRRKGYIFLSFFGVYLLIS